MVCVMLIASCEFEILDLESLEGEVSEMSSSFSSGGNFRFVDAASIRFEQEMKDLKSSVRLEDALDLKRIRKLMRKCMGR